MKSPARAVVVGLCAHGLAVCRALERRGISVVALEKNRALPGFRTNSARVIQVPDVHESVLVDALLKVRTEMSDAPPALMLTNDNMVRTVAKAWERLEGEYRVSWKDSRSQVLSLLDKSNLEAHCRARELLYPKSKYVEGLDDLNEVGDELRFPLIAKPTVPLSGFKVRRLRCVDELRVLVEENSRDLPFLVQEWIAGGDESLYFAAMYLRDGRVKGSFSGHKLRSLPPGLGQTTVAEPLWDADVYRLTEEFFAGTGLSGPVSLEAKRDQEGRLYVIEPTVGRTDYWVDCCIANGVDFPYLEYQDVMGGVTEMPAQVSSRVWFDTERDPLSYIAVSLRRKQHIWDLRRARFAYWEPGDWRPSLQAWYHTIHRAWMAVGRRICRRLGLATSV